MIRKYSATNPEFVDTYDAYSQIMYISGDTVVIPYINAGLMEGNPVTQKRVVVDYSYYLLTGVRSIHGFSAAGELRLDIAPGVDHLSITAHITFGGYGSIGSECKVECKDLYFFVDENAVLSDHLSPFMPVDTPRFKQNLPAVEVNAFFQQENLPPEIKAEIGSTIYRLFWK